MDNNEVIARGGGSPQARWVGECSKGGSCPICNGKGYVEVANGEDDFDKEPCDNCE